MHYSIPLLFLTLLPLCNTACSSTTGCYPPIQNIPTQINAASISATNTCGQAGPELSCPLIGFTLGDISECYNCTSSEHPSSLAIDGDSNTWWQAGNDVIVVNLQLDFSAPFLVSETTLIWFSPRARSMILEYSTDYGSTWYVYQYYSPNCQFDFQLPSSPDPSNSSLGTTSVCDSTQSNINPYSGGVISFSPAARILGGITNYSTIALSYFLVTNLRARILSFNRIVGIINEGYFHAVSEWRVQGSCFCNGHADACNITEPSTCICRHNTEGDNCQRCLPLFNNGPYLPGTLIQDNACQQCQCYSHATSCVYDSSIGSGVCQGCQDNTIGDSCESCLPFFYRDAILLLTDPDICRPCNCDPDGTADTGECQVSTGDCFCKANVFGRQCNQCKIGFYNLSSQQDGCQACACNEAGSLSITCESDNGQCSCKQNTEGIQCGTCKDGYYGLSTGNSEGCQVCGCDMGGASSPVCDKLTGECMCLPNFTDSKCDSVESGYFLPAPDYLLFEGETGNPGETDVPGYEGLNIQLLFTGEGLVRVERGQTLEFIIEVPRFLDYIPVLRYFTLQTGAVNMEILLMDNLERCEVYNRVQSAVLNNSNSYISFLPTCLQEAPTLYRTSLTPTDATLWIDSLVLVPDPTLSPIYSLLIPQQQDEVQECVKSFYPVTSTLDSCSDTLFSLLANFYQSALPCNCDPISSSSGICNDLGGQCPCREGVNNRDCSSCIPGYHSISTQGCTACNCDVMGALILPCNATTGQCVCKTGVTNLACDTCQLGFYDLTNLGCQQCVCSDYSSGMECDNSGQCNCRSGVTGEKCTECSEGYFQLSPAGCQVCQCSVQTTDSIQCSEQGICSCVNGFTGDKCTLCAQGNYVTPGDTGPVCEECKCFTQTNICSNLTQGYILSEYSSDFSICQIQSDIPLTECDMGWLVEDGFYLQLATNQYITFIIISPTQVYWKAPFDPFLGDRSLSYGQNIMLSVFSEDLIDELPFIGPHPDLIMEGSFLPDQLVSSFTGEVSSGPGTPFSIPLLENSWRVGSLNGPVATYAQLIQVLANLTSLRIKARYSEASIARTSMEYFILETLVKDPTADGLVVEDCECPAAYTGTFCQYCSQGFYRPSLNPIDSCTPCECNGHTELCDPITGTCQSCQDSTTGDNCEICVSGFYGDATLGTATDCLMCPCPLVAPQSFSNTCFLGSDGLPTCDNCTVGHTGRTCEFCEDGYFGTPMLIGSHCATCTCSENIDLSQTGNCNTTSGECLMCLNNTAGFECELCAPGYYGDALLDTCAPCQCNRLGREDNVCDQRSGVCSCKEHVIEDLCDTCEDGYWGLHFGLPEGCISCDCCSNGSISHTCNTSTGVCSCNTNVGGVRDIKCCACSSNAFNFTGTGCDLCGCDMDGSIGESCHQLTGVCQCDIGVEGNKCDVCSFGYTGSPPNCEKCPQCFDDWLALIQTERTAVLQLDARVDTLLTSYLPLTIQNISTQINQLNTQLSTAASLAGSSNLNMTQLTILESILSVLSQNLTTLHEQLNELNTSLSTTLANLEHSRGFDGSIISETGDVISHTILMTELVALMNIIQETQKTANDTIRQIAAEVIQITVARASIESSNERITLYTNTSLQVLRQLEAINNTVISLIQEYETNRITLTYLAQKEERIASELNDSRIMISKAIPIAVSTGNRTNEALMLAYEKARRAEYSLNSIQRIYNNSNQTYIESETVFDDSLSVLYASMQAAYLANTTQTSQSGNITTLRELYESENITREILQDTLAITGPDPAIAQELSKQINQQIVSVDVVEMIRTDANSSLLQANRASEIALQAKQAASNASSLLIEVTKYISLSQVTQSMTNVPIENAKNALLSASEAVREFYNETEELLNTSERIFSLSRDVERIDDELFDKYLKTKQNATTANLACTNACQQAVALNTNLQEQVILIDLLSNNVTEKDNYVTQNFNTLNSLIIATNSSLQEVVSVQLSELEMLLDALAAEQEAIAELKLEFEEVEREITEVGNSISNLAELYETCLS
ncbi:Laminin beta/gamma [Oopsacas minuta]|uniref:Laminin beta/gamma n=1 Tax=Oopsacas minuta TaxID=111878 RepID=A0AAV7JDE3_9METZ|nr:Laminin beta/gamma [Oopsacas minuta]